MALKVLDRIVFILIGWIVIGFAMIFLYHLSPAKTIVDFIIVPLPMLLLEICFIISLIPCFFDLGYQRYAKLHTTARKSQYHLRIVRIIATILLLSGIAGSFLIIFVFFS